MTHRASHQRERGVTLVELVVSIAVIAIAGAALVGTLAYLSGTGTTSIVQAQAQSVANAYLNEISGKSYLDPDGVNGEASRPLYDDVFDYNNLSDPAATDERLNAAGNFSVGVIVVPTLLNAVPAARIDVTVKYGNGYSVVATGYRTKY